MPSPATFPDDAAGPAVAQPLAVRAQAPAALPLPAPVGGLTFATLDPGDLTDLSGLVSRIEDADNPPYRTSDEELAEYFGDTHHWAALGARDVDGVLRAFGFVRVRTGDTTLLRAFCSGGVDPVARGRGVGSALLDWQVARGRQLLVATGKDAPARVVVHVDDGMPTLSDLVTSRGFTPRRWYTEMRRDLSLPLPEVQLDRLLTVEPWSADLDDAVRRAHNRAFADHWGSQPHTPESWQESRTHFAPQWSFVALDRSSDRTQVAGYLMSARYEQDWPALGWTEGYTDLIGVLPEWRGRRLASALLTAAMAAYRADGMEYAGLDVDSDNLTGAVGLYAKLGYEPTRTSAMYSIEI
ncbi:GNAT family N-acetyltransferase [Georgenia sp. TF02-10]|uniref:GNAT family N-acetyltransferase n=1 Tax=Georgenia sp. TF02-10 TaxID=2917725 RepID=UPI001FA7F991|nr:GNAT family N-acetyltransferase [Georgenia sp. TF02-10]UNX53391.1 GNAT family N-acetyltransferase [Georgenia sp. TF02-10]